MTAQAANFKILLDSKFTTIGLLLVTLSAVNIQLGSYFRERVRTLSTSNYAESVLDTAKPEWIRAVSIAELPTVINWIWIRLIQTAGDGIQLSERQKVLIVRQLQTLTDLDPAFFNVYYAGGSILSVLLEKPNEAVRLLEKGLSFYRNASVTNDPRIANFKSPWVLSIVKAYTELFELDNLSEAAKTFTEAGQMAQLDPAAPTYLKALAERIRKPDGLFDVGFRLLDFMMLSESDPKSKENLVRKKKNLELILFLKHINQSWLKLSNTQRKSRFLPADFPKLDPFGGQLYIRDDGFIDSKTEYKKVFGLDFTIGMGKAIESGIDHD